MEYRRLGSSGLRVSALCLGTYNFGNATSEEIARSTIQTALGNGINFVDTADSYASGESERIIGRFLKDTHLRDELLLVTKVYYATGPGPNDSGLSRHHIINACEDSLRRLQTDHIDIYLTHRPVFDMPIDEVLVALDSLARQGKICYAGSSTYPAWKIVEAIKVSEARGYIQFVCESPPYNLLDRRVENEIVPACQAYGLGLMPWSPIAMGMLAGRYPPSDKFPHGSRAAASPEGIYAQRIRRRGLDVAAAVVSMAQEYNLTPAQLSLVWLKDQPGVTSPIIGPRDPAQLREMLQIADMHPEPGLLKAFDKLNPPGAAVANFFNTSGWMKDAVVEGY